LKHPRWLWIVITFLLINGGMRLYESNLGKEYSGVLISLSGLITIITLHYGSQEGFFPIKAYKYLNISFFLLFFFTISTFYGVYTERKKELILLKDIKNRNDTLNLII